MPDVFVDEFAPLFLTVDRVGPFQARMEVFDFTDSNDEPCNAYLMISKNGRGKTTVMEMLAAMMGMLGTTECTSLGFEAFDRERGRAQWDLRVTLRQDGVRETVILSLVAGFMGEEASLRPWGESDCKTYGAVRWCRFGFVRNAFSRYSMVGRSDPWTQNFNLLIQSALGDRLSGFESDALSYPTLIYFSAYRNIVRTPDEERAIIAPRDWNYRPVHLFDVEGHDWRDSLDNLLVWLKWLDDGRFDKAVAVINERVFKVGDPTLSAGKRLKGIRKEPPEAIVESDDGQQHRLDRLSSGEKSLVQLYLRLGSHMTQNTIVLVDEPEVHLHRSLQYDVLYTLTNLAQQHFPHVAVFLATHSERMMKAYALNQAEHNLRKGAYIIETAEEENQAERIAADAAAKASTQ
ncbi:AAA family ATPase [uncultured Thiodictyon sp.]|jgi:predicted ATPase|uniref:AAA family ATPase n=1 Tax=uncultured Thiodictyon sp. TaxID=1846217 RepID=UPI0025EDE347|nr:AAA family ATPase [uncultured Thiodictyon sp.]